MQKLSWINCNQCLDSAEEMPHPITAQEAADQQAALAQYHAEHTED